MGHQVKRWLFGGQSIATTVALFPLARKSGIDDSHNVVGCRAKLMRERLRPERRITAHSLGPAIASPLLHRAFLYALNRRERRRIAAMLGRMMGADRCDVRVPCRRRRSRRRALGWRSRTWRDARRDRLERRRRYGLSNGRSHIRGHWRGRRGSRTCGCGARGSGRRRQCSAQRGRQNGIGIRTNRS